MTATLTAFDLPLRLDTEGTIRVGRSRVTLDTVVEAYQRGLSIFPQDVHMLIRYGQVLGILGRFHEAESAYRAAIKLDQNFSKGHAYYARHLAIVGRDEEAEAEFEKAKNLAYGNDVFSIVRGTSLDPDAVNAI